jgi:hypothetical protein
VIHSSAEIAKEFEQASKKLMKKVLRSKRSAQSFLIRAGILDKDGKRLAKPYR